MSNVLVDRELLAGLVSNDRETRLDAERRMYGVLANQPAEADGVEVTGFLYKNNGQALTAADMDADTFALMARSDSDGDVEKLVRQTDHLAALSAVTAERDRLAEKVEKVRSRCVSVSSAPDAVIPNALDAWGRPVKQHLPYDFSGNPGVSATQYCNGWNDSGSYWKAHCIDLQTERDQLRAEVEALRNKATPATVPSHD